VRLRLAETQAASAKASEQRLAEEANQLRLENSRQGGLNQTVLRLEASLSARSAAEAEGLKTDIVSFREKLAAESAARAAENEKADGQISDQETRIKELEQQKEEAVKESLKAKEKSLETASELQKVTSKANILESQLRVAKKKLGETGDDKDTEGDLSAKVVSLTTELEAKRKEAETLKERVATFEKLAKDNEAALAELNKATSAAKSSEAEEIEQLKSELETAKSETVKRKDLITELTNDLAKNRDERTEALAELNKKIATLRDEAETHQKNAQAVEDRNAQLDSEVSGLKKDISTAQVRNRSASSGLASMNILSNCLPSVFRTITKGSLRCMQQLELNSAQLARKPRLRLD
jgi:chromosome segregation ATPase